MTKLCGKNVKHKHGSLVDVLGTLCYSCSLSRCTAAVIKLATYIPFSCCCINLYTLA